ncbi:hypothetical protein BDU57DRAFT_61681 [Ampelomyces quisqualis]|uniref:Uncharacterized protein n=1 Tax=Ampelomyces quisqualis TaxID=50730 RepID=A0A6A5R2Z2_AMPQU|nr:hypothetical protein BDU57DRAFT_61681 [Ampelomyces quisqualis]
MTHAHAQSCCCCSIISGPTHALRVFTPHRSHSQLFPHPFTSSLFSTARASGQAQPLPFASRPTYAYTYTLHRRARATAFLSSSHNGSPSRALALRLAPRHASNRWSWRPIPNDLSHDPLEPYHAVTAHPTLFNSH